jgi:hypothetical protein
MDYVLELPFLKWDKQGIIDFMQSYPANKWQHERNSSWIGDQTYVNKYLRTAPSVLFDDIVLQLPELELDHAYTFFMELNPGVLLPPHADVGRTAVINFPLIGDWGNTPVRFHSTLTMSKASVIYEHVYTCPTLLNVSKLHSAYNVTQQTRYMLSMSVHKSWDQIKEIVNKHAGVAQW